jgi:hypothetical protein
MVYIGLPIYTMGIFHGELAMSKPDGNVPDAMDTL